MNLISNFFITTKNNFINSKVDAVDDTELMIQQKLILIATYCIVNDKMHEFSIGYGLLSVSNRSFELFKLIFFEVC